MALCQIMRFSYILHNKDGRGVRVPRGQAWQWVHEVNSLDQLRPILKWIESRVQVDELSLMNVYLDHQALTAHPSVGVEVDCPSQIVYSRMTVPHRIIQMHTPHPDHES